MEKSGKWYKPNSTTALSDAEVEKHEDEQDAYDQKEAQVRELIYETISNSLFLQIKGETSAAGVWKKLTEICEKQGSLVASDTLTQLQLLRFNPEDDDDIEKHTATPLTAPTFALRYPTSPHSEISSRRSML